MKLIQNINIGENLEYYRKAKGYSQLDVVAKMQLYGSKMSSNTYSKIERGERNIFFDDFIILKIVLEFEYSEFFKRYEEELATRSNE